MGMIDEQRLRARIAALDAAARIFASDKAMLTEPTATAAHFEDWLMRSSPADADVPKVDVRVRQPCGAFEQPPWFIGRVWLTCSGRHRPEDGWHLSGNTPHEIVFHSHHAPAHAGPERCACGSTELPCPDADPMDMKK